MSLPEHTLTIYDHPEPHSHRWSDLELEAIKRYAEAYALQAVEALRREPMTDEEAAECINNAKTSLFDRDGTTSFRIVRAVEAFHHITQKEQGK